MSGADIHALLADIGATARPAGSAAEARARAVCATWLRDVGFMVEERPFTYSALPGTWGTPIAGLILLLTAVLTASGIARGGASVDRPLQRAMVVLVGVGVAGWWVGRYGTLLLPFQRRSGVNLEARRGVPKVWLVAHLDSKSQPVSLLARALASIAVVGSWACVIAVWGASRMISAPTAALFIFLGCAGVAAVPLLVSWPDTRGDGALDNASGVASILAAAAFLDLAIPLGVVVTSAEELGLAGSRAWVDGRPGGVAINCDGVDDGGTLTLTASGRGCELWQSGNWAEALGPDARIRRSLPGILLDSTAFADRGWAACTISQGTRRSLGRIHTEQDTLSRLSGAGIERIAKVIAALSGAIIAGG